jgi:hypothetical protein
VNTLAHTCRLRASLTCCPLSSFKRLFPRHSWLPLAFCPMTARSLYAGRRGMPGLFEICCFVHCGELNARPCQVCAVRAAGTAASMATLAPMTSHLPWSTSLARLEGISHLARINDELAEAVQRDRANARLALYNRWPLLAGLDTCRSAEGAPRLSLDALQSIRVRCLCGHLPAGKMSWGVRAL